MFGFNIKEILIGAVVTLIALSVHEFAHGFVSSKLGDPTPRMQGRLTLNPMAHLDPVGTILMILTGFGWAKPVQINPMYYKDRVKGMALVALAGPLSNLILAFLGLLIGVLIMLLGYKANMDMSLAIFITQTFVIRNLCFMVFNLIPFPPLDGFKIAGVIFPRELYYKILQYEQYIMYLLIFLSLTGFFSRIIGAGVNIVYNILFSVVYNLLGFIM